MEKALLLEFFTLVPEVGCVLFFFSIFIIYPTVQRYFQTDRKEELLALAGDDPKG